MIPESQRHRRENRRIKNFRESGRRILAAGHKGHHAFYCKRIQAVSVPLLEIVGYIRGLLFNSVFEHVNDFSVGMYSPDF